MSRTLTTKKIATITPIIVAVLGVTGTIIAALIQAAPEKEALAAERTATALAAQTASAASPTAFPAATDALNPTAPPPATLPAVPLTEIFPLLGGGERFIFTNNNGILEGALVTTPACVHSGAYGLQLTWEMKASGVGSWGISWAPDPAGHFDASSYQSFTFRLRGAAGGETFQLGMRDTNGGETILESSTLLVVPSGWTQLTVPLASFTDVNPAMLENFHFGFNKEHGSGSLCIDDITFAP